MIRFLFILLSVCSLNAATIQVAQNSQGATQSMTWASTQANWGADTVNRSPIFVFDGDSLVYGTPNPGKGIDYWLTNIYGAQLTGLVVKTNASLAGVLVGDSLIRYPTNVSAWKPTSGNAGFFLTDAGVNDIQGATTFGQVTNFYNSLTNIWGKAKVDGFTVVACTIFRGSNIFDATEITLLERFNELITNAVAPKWDILVDWDHIAGLTNQTHDGLHLTTNGYRIVADLLFTNITAGIDKIGPGDTVMLNGTITNALTIGTNGTVASPIEVQFASGAVMSKPYWPTTGAIAIGTFSNLVVNGGSNGKILNTMNGKNLTYQQDSTAIVSGFSQNLTIKNLLVTNMYVQGVVDAGDVNRMGYATDLQGNSITIMDCTLSSGDTMIAYTFNTTYQANIAILRNVILDVNHGITLGNSVDNDILLQNVVIASNRIDKLDVWDGATAYHLDGMIFFNDTYAETVCVSNFVIHANVIGPNIGTNTTAGIFFNGYNARQFKAVRIYNNVFLQALNYFWSNGHISVIGDDVLVANNTFYGLNTNSGKGITASGTNVTILGNLFYGIGTPISTVGGSSSVLTNTIKVCNSNVFYTAGLVSEYYVSSIGIYQLAQWRADHGWDANSSTNQPLLDANYIPTSSDTVAKSIGLDLSSYFTKDKNGATRVDWYAGAFEYQTGEAPSPRVSSTLNGRVFIGGAGAFIR